MVNVSQHEILARFVELLAPGTERVPSANEPADLASASSCLQPGAVGWAVEVSHRCADAVVSTMGERVSLLPEAETRRAIETSVLALLRHIAGHTGQTALNAEQVSQAHKMARAGLRHERFTGGLRLVQTLVLDALLDRAMRHRPVQTRRLLLTVLPAVVTGFFDASVGAVISEYLAERQRAISQTLADRRRMPSRRQASTRASIQMTGCGRTGLSSRTCASGLLAIRPSRTAAFSADRNVARTRSTVEAAISVPFVVRWRASRLEQACSRFPVRSASVMRPILGMR
jgi:hypothetical protein